MEALVIIFAEIVLVCMLPVVALVGTVVSIGLELIFTLLGGSFAAWAAARRAKRQGQEPDGQTAASAPRAMPLVPRKLIHWTAGILGTLGVAGVVASMLFFQPILRFVVETANEKTGVHLSYETAEGSLLKGQVSLTGVQMRRDGETGVGFDLTVENADADVSLWSLVTAMPTIQMASVSGVRGHVSVPERDGQKPTEKRKKRPFMATHLQISDVEIEVRPAGGEAYAVVIPQATVAPFRSRAALFDLLFRSNLEAEIAGQALLVSTRKITEYGRETHWSFEDVEVEKLRRLLPRVPVTWLENGTVSATVEDRWSLSDHWIDMDWNVTFNEVDVSAPADSGLGEKVLAGAFSEVVKARGGNAEFTYRLRLSEDQINEIGSNDLDHFWDLVLKGFLERAPEDTDPNQRQGEAEGFKPVSKALERLNDILGKDEDE